MHLDRVTVTDLLHELEGCDPDAEVCLAQQPAWPPEYAIDPTNAHGGVGQGGTAVASLGEGAQLGYLPDPAARSPAGSRHQHPRRRAGGPGAPRAAAANGQPVRASDLEATMPEDPQQPRYPDVQVQLSGEDGNAFAILGRTAASLRAAGVPQEEIDTYFAQATSGDYDHLLQTTMAWVDWA